MITEEFESFLSENEHRIYHYLVNILGNEADAQDLVQETFIAFYEHIDGIEKARAVAYTYRIAHNKAMNLLKKKKIYSFHPPQDFEHIPDTGFTQNPTDYSALHKALKELPEKLGMVIHLQYYDKLSYKEIAEQTGYSFKAVESLIVRAKKTLRKKLLQESTP